MDENRVLQWYADWTASAGAYRAAVVTGMNVVLADLGLDPVEVA